MQNSLSHWARIILGAITLAVLSLSAKADFEKYSLRTESELVPLMSLSFDGRKHQLANHGAGMVTYYNTSGDDEPTFPVFDVNFDNFGDNRTLNVDLVLPNIQKQFWTINTPYTFTGIPGSAKMVFLRYEDDGSWQQLDEVILNKQGFFTLNLGNDHQTEKAYQVLRMHIKRIDPQAEGRIRLTQLTANSKENLFTNRSIVNFINTQTINNLTSEHDRQLAELYAAGHRTWILSGLRDLGIQPDQIFERIQDHPVLSKCKFTIFIHELATNEFCEVHQYTDRSSETYQHEPARIFPIGSGKSIRDLDQGFVTVLANAAELKSLDLRTDLDTLLANHVSEYVRVIRDYDHLINGIMLFDEPDHHGVPASYQEDVYRWFNRLLPNKCIVSIYSFYVGKTIVANRVTLDEASTYVTRNANDVHLFDHYTPGALYLGSDNRQLQLTAYHDHFKMFSKPYAKLLYGATSPAWTCDDLDSVTGQFIRKKTVADFKGVYDLTESVRDILPEFQRKNGDHMGYWAFFNRTAFGNHLPSWLSTLVNDSDEFCENQYDAVIENSKEYFLRD